MLVLSFQIVAKKVHHCSNLWWKGAIYDFIWSQIWAMVACWPLLLFHGTSWRDLLKFGVIDLGVGGGRGIGVTWVLYCTHALYTQKSVKRVIFHKQMCHPCDTFRGSIDYYLEKKSCPCMQCQTWVPPWPPLCKWSYTSCVLFVVVQCLICLIYIKSNIMLYANLAYHLSTDLWCNVNIRRSISLVSGPIIDQNTSLILAR